MLAKPAVSVGHLFLFFLNVIMRESNDKKNRVSVRLCDLHFNRSALQAENENMH